MKNKETANNKENQEKRQGPWPVAGGVLCQWRHCKGPGLGKRWKNKGVAVPLTPQNLPGKTSKLQTACFSSHAELQTPSFFFKTRLDELYLVIGGLGGQKREINPKMIKKTVYAKLKKYASEYLTHSF